MKKTLILLPVLSLLALTGCNSGGGSDDNSGNDPTSQSSGGGNLPYSKEQASNKLRDLGEEQGLQIEYHAFDEDTEDVIDYTFGMKDEFVWHYSDEDQTVLKIDSSNTLYEYTNTGEDSAYELVSTFPDGAEYYDQLIDGYTMMFFFANDYSNGYTKVRDLTFVGRSASEYHYSVSYAGVASLSMTAIIDKDTGITLYWDATGDDYVDGEHGSATFEVTSFKVGSQVALPPIEE